jgi:hypothetical protein
MDSRSGRSTGPAGRLPRRRPLALTHSLGSTGVARNREGHETTLRGSFLDHLIAPDASAVVNEFVMNQSSFVVSQVMVAIPVHSCMWGG